MYVIHYKDGEALPELLGYVHVWAGKPDHLPCSTQLTGDNTGDNISSKNKYYSELTAIYWVWKNHPSPVVGICHYRRLYSIKEEPFAYRIKRLLYFPIGLWKKRYGLIYTSNTAFWKQHIISMAEAESFLSIGYDAIMPLQRKLRYSVEKHFERYHRAEDLRLAEQIINDLHPEFLATFQTMLKGNRIYANNMFVLRKADFDKLCEWLFSILFEFENRINLEQFTGYQERILGFISERLITTWVIHNKLKVKELPLIYFKYLKNR